MAKLPTLNKADVKRATEQKLLTPDQWMAFVVTGGKAEINERKGHYQLRLTCAPLTDQNDPDSKSGPLLYDSISLPNTNEDWTDDEGNPHTPPDTYGLLASRMFAFYGEKSDDNPDGLVRAPRKEGATLVYDGEAIDESDREECREEAATAVLNRGIELYTEMVETGECPLEGKYVFFAKIAHNEYQGKIYQNISDIAAELPENAKLVTDSKLFRHKA